MKTLKYILGSVLALGCSYATYAQDKVTVNDPWADYPTKEDMYKDYSKFSLGLNIGSPYFAGDFRSVTRGNSYGIGALVGLQAAYQFNPLFGVRLSAEYGMNRAGSQSYEDNFLMLPDASTYYNTDIPVGSMMYKDLYSRINMLNIGLHWETELLNLFRRSDGNRRWALVAAPGIYMQYFNSSIYKRSDGSKFATGAGNKLGVGLGGDLSLRYRLNQHIDLQAKGSMVWIGNDKFDGVNSINAARHNSVITAQIGVVWKLGNGKCKKKDNIMYAPGYLPMWKRATKTITVTKTDTIYIEKKILDKSRNVVVVKGFPKDLPAVYFERGKWNLDTDKYARELFAIAKAMKENPNVHIDIYGYADHTGGESINKKVTEKRAEALKDWLVKVGIEPERINTYGLGKDMTISKELRYKVDARRTEVKEK